MPLMGGKVLSKWTEGQRAGAAEKATGQKGLNSKKARGALPREEDKGGKETSARLPPPRQKMHSLTKRSKH